MAYVELSTLICSYCDSTYELLVFNDIFGAMITQFLSEIRNSE
jgi:hypothetical protein